MALNTLVHWRTPGEQTLCGRTELLATISDGLESGDSFAVIGQRGMGKSMLLDALCQRRRSDPGSGVICALVRLSGREASAFSVIEEIRDSVALVLAQALERNEQEIRRAISTKMSPTTSSPLLELVSAAGGVIGHPVCLELLLDDVHRLQGQSWTTDLLANLEHELFSQRANSQSLRAVFAGDLRMRELLQALPFSNLWQQLRDEWLQALTGDDVVELVGKLAVPESWGNARTLGMLISEWTGGHPALTQYMLRDLVQSRERVPSVTLEISASRFLNELSKMLEASWSNLPVNVQETIIELSASVAAVPVDSVRAKHPQGSPQFAKTLNEALATGFVRMEKNMLFPPGRVLRSWLVALESSSASRSGDLLLPVYTKREAAIFPTILHLSDIHFGGEGHAWEQTSEIPGVGRPLHDRTTLLNSLLQDLNLLRQEGENLWPRCVVVSGDLLFQSSKEGVEQAADFLKSLTAKLGLEPESVVMCPGNHEQNRAIMAQEPLAQLALYRDIWNKFYPGDFRRLPLEWSPDGYTHVYRIGTLEVLSLNSCEDLAPGADSGDSLPREQGYVGIQQLGTAAELLGRQRPPDGTIRVAVLHHHLSQYRGATGVDYSIMREVERVISWLRDFHFDMVLHGHQHCVGLQTRVIDGRYLTIMAGGSLGVAAKHRWRGGMPLLYQLVCGCGPRQAVRICRSFDLYTENWQPYAPEKATSFPIGEVM